MYLSSIWIFHVTKRNGNTESVCPINHQLELQKTEEPEGATVFYILSFLCADI